MNAVHRRGACPDLSAPMPTGDGLLVRLRPREPIPLDAFVGFCSAASRHGNGTIEISARGSLQVRGLTPRSAPLFAAAVTELGIVAQQGVPVIAGPLVRDPHPTIETVNVATELRRALGNTRLALSPKVSIVVDGDGPPHLDALSADIRLRAVGPAHQSRFCVGLGGDGASATWLGSIAPKDAVRGVLGILAIIAARGPTTRAIDILRAEGVEAFRSISATLIEPLPMPSRRRSAEMVGLHAARDGTIAVGIGLAFGHAHSGALADIARMAATYGTGSMWPAPDRTMLLIGVAPTGAVRLMAAAEQLGFVSRADDPRRRIAACPGAPACALGLIPARALASALALSLEPVLESRSDGIAVHISGCPKGCAHPMPTALTVVGTPSGCGVVYHGSARATPDHYIDPANLGAEVSRIAVRPHEAAHG